MVVCDKCYGRGWYPEMIPGTEYDYNEKYCDCQDGKRLKEIERPRNNRVVVSSYTA